MLRKTEVPYHKLKEYFQGITSLRKPYQDAPLILTLTGWRMGAVVRMRWDELDLENASYRVPRGGIGWKGYEGDIALSKTVVDLLSARHARMKAAKQLNEWVFPKRNKKERATHAIDISDGIVEAGKAAGLDISPHDLRRTWSTAAHFVGLDALTISRLTAHEHEAAKGGDNPANAWTAVGAGYIMQQLRAESFASEQVANLLLELGGMRPVSQGTRDLFARKGLELPAGL